MAGNDTDSVWTWEITGLGTDEQTLHVYGPSGAEVGAVTQDGFSWPSDRWPEQVSDLMPTTIAALMALQRGDIERAE